jgi:hypothetical protein
VGRLAAGRTAHEAIIAERVQTSCESSTVGLPNPS